MAFYNVYIGELDDSGPGDEIQVDPFLQDLAPERRYALVAMES